MWKVSNARETAWTNGEVVWHLRVAPRSRRDYLRGWIRMVGFAGTGPARTSGRSCQTQQHSDALAASVTAPKRGLLLWVRDFADVELVAVSLQRRRLGIHRDVGSMDSDATCENEH